MHFELERARLLKCNMRGSIRDKGSKEITLMKVLVNRFVRDESGVAAMEYGLIAALISVVIITAASSVGTSIAAVFTGIYAQLAAAA